MFSNLCFVRYWNSLPRLRRSVSFILIWSSIIIFASYLYIRSWSPNHGLQLDISIIPEILKQQNWFPKEKLENKTLNDFNLEQWLVKYPRDSCEPSKCKSAYNSTTDIWNNQRIKGYIGLHESQNKELLDPNQKCEYIFIGDSITFGWKINQDVFDANFNTNNNGVIYAHNGDIISDIGWRLKHGDGFKNMKQCLLNHPLPQKSMVLLIGTNDLAHGTPYDVALKDYEALLNQFVEFLEEINKKQRVVLNVIAIFPRGWRYEPCPACEMWNANNTKFRSVNFVNEYLKLFVEHQGNDRMRFIDCNRDLLQRVDSVDWTDLNGESHQFTTGYINTTIFPDRLHLGHFKSVRSSVSLGYEKWTACLKRPLK